MTGTAGPPLRIAVCGGSVANGEVLDLAERVGRGIAEAGAVLVCGGLAGVMEAAARGAARAGGLTLGVLPGTDAARANEHITLPLPTGMGEGRNVLVVRFAEAVIAIAGQWGTLSEVALARKIGIPVVLLAPEIAAGVGDLMEAEDDAAAVEQALLLARAARNTRTS